MMIGKNKVYQYLSDYRLPTTLPYKEALGLYWQRVIIIAAITLAAMVASALIALIIITFQKGYGWILVVVAIIFFLGGGGSSSAGRTPPPPPSGTPEKEGQSDESKGTPIGPEWYKIPARLNPPKQKELAGRLDEDD